MTNNDSDNSREWAAQAYALLKKRQEEQKGCFIESFNKDNLPTVSKTTDEPKLGEFDDNFTWSAMVLAAQGKKINQIPSYKHSLHPVHKLTTLQFHQHYDL